MKNVLKKMGLLVLATAMVGSAAFAETEMDENLIAEPTAVVEVVVQEPTEEPVEEATEVETEEQVEIEVEIEEATEVETEEEAEEAEAFAGEVEIKLENEGDIYFGDTVTLRAVVRSANAGYTIRWEVNKDGSEDGWKVIEDETKDTYSFEVTEENVAYAYRAVLVAE